MESSEPSLDCFAYAKVSYTELLSNDTAQVWPAARLPVSCSISVSAAASASVAVGGVRGRWGRFAGGDRSTRVGRDVLKRGNVVVRRRESAINPAAAVLGSERASEATGHTVQVGRCRSRSEADVIRAAAIRQRDR